MGLSRKIKMLELRMPGGIIPARYLYLNHSKCFLVFGAWFHNDLFYKALQIAPERMRYCKKMDAYLVERMNRVKPKTLAQIESIWYEGYRGSRNRHYHDSRYHFLNLHSFFNGNHTVELRGFNGTLHAGKIRAYIVFALALNNQALTQKSASYRKVQEENEMLEKQVTTLIENEKEKYKKELNGLKGQKAKLENKRQKLLEAHYSNAIPLDLLKAEQQKIAKELATIEHEIRIHNTTFEAIVDNLKAALDIIENCGETYRYADDATKRLMNQAIFKRFLVSNDSENGLKVDAELASPFAQLQEPIKDDLIRINHASPERAKTLLDTIKAHLQAYFGDGLYDDVLSANSSSKGKNLVDTSKLEKSDKNTISSADCQDARQSEDKKKSASNFSDADLPYKSAFIETHSNPSNFFGSNISSKGVLVEMAVIETASENPSAQLSTSVAGLLVIPLRERQAAGSPVR